MRLAVRVTPRGGRDAVEGWTVDDAGRAVLKVRVAAAPTDGSANAAVIALLAKALKRPKSSLRLVSGETARLKLIEAEGLDEAGLAAAFGPRPTA
ncbi:MAG: DUF167 family protein [Phenylobacterium sp.]|jgi:uncharacterized protein YggU (UPF0235/DUF167 family)|uniref:DUF167 family protein n=1 Tax=Phenylobacterium sp. TaxID=1871053 RepID=UPI002A36AB14|nr:DUF167 family protein [Phenylobacterium sp.]MDX9999152.1 DUF167 family protein [Phenylobacterium sp.]